MFKLTLAGLTCHQCRNRKSTLVNCTNTDCTKRYCEGCLNNHYNLESTTLLSQGIWSCPYCRNCCSCISCKRTRGEEPEYKSTQVFLHLNQLTVCRTILSPKRPKNQRILTTLTMHCIVHHAKRNQINCIFVTSVQQLFLCSYL